MVLFPYIKCSESKYREEMYLQSKEEIQEPWGIPFFCLKNWPLNCKQTHMSSMS